MNRKSKNVQPKLKSGNRLDETLSALQKALRRGQEYNAMMLATDLCESGLDELCWTRLAVISVEDIGLASPQAVTLVNSLAEIWERHKKQRKDHLPEFNILALAILALSRSPKNRQADDLATLVELDRLDGKSPIINPEAIDGHTARGKRNLQDQAKKIGKNWTQLFNEQFFHDAGRSNKPTEVGTGADGINWSKILCKRLKCNYKKYMTLKG
ncbi:MAG: hypothetical protein AAB091_00040 [Elusimicrobiota bacterium]